MMEEVEASDQANFFLVVNTYILVLELSWIDMTKKTFNV